MLDVKRWAQPQEIEKAQQVFPGDVTDLMPAYKDVPQEFKEHHNPWAQWASMVFFQGYAGDPDQDRLVVWPRDDVDANKAFTHLHTVLGSFQPKHEHKEAAVAYLASRWFSQVAFTKEFAESGKFTAGS